MRLSNENNPRRNHRPRKFIGIEKDAAHFETACRRIRDAYKQPDMFVEVARVEAQQEALAL
jgi:site-specific DNA-methyltransferase (adenine-specific)